MEKRATDVPSCPNCIQVMQQIAGMMDAEIARHRAEMDRLNRLKEEKTRRG
jgi:ribosomal protein L34E